MATAKKAAPVAAKKNSKTAVVETATRVQDPALNKTQQKIFDGDLPKSEKFRKLFAHGLSKSHIARLFGSPYSFVRAAIERQEGLEEMVAEKKAAKETKAEA